VFLDADTMLISNADELFDREEFSAAPDAGQPYALTVPSGGKGGGCRMDRLISIYKLNVYLFSSFFNLFKDEN